MNFQYNPLEICLASDTKVFEANLKILAQYPIEHIELCASMSVGGLTPKYEQITHTKSFCPNARLMCMIRPHANSFVYNQDDINLMLKQIRLAKQCGADGVVFGALTKDSLLAEQQIKVLLECAKSLDLKTTFHRAFDAVKHPTDAIEKLVSWQFDHILTAGSLWEEQVDLINNMSTIEQYLRQLSNDCQLIVSGGLAKENLSAILPKLSKYQGRYLLHSYSGVLTDNRIDEEKLNAILTMTRA
ncbi:copper homeostasis protein CutC [Thalassotalea marina]|uniref:Copper homeostasis protein cutC homolog n=1 Tax=Thalassotalea marina TaxID=1673741 RepID=A0A919BFH3_9GAMM|nr:copper homeostasis protein CutC [Thalassotalea marina]GHF85286.1 hypothetical protein GCM10017161_11050 [Thalassotalea marina]